MEDNGILALFAHYWYIVLSSVVVTVSYDQLTLQRFTELTNSVINSIQLELACQEIRPDLSNESS